MRLFSGRNRPVHLGPYPLELLKRAAEPLAGPPRPDRPPVDRSIGDDLAGTLRFYRELFEQFRDGTVASEILWLLTELRKARGALTQIVALAHDVNDSDSIAQRIRYVVNAALGLYAPAGAARGALAPDPAAAGSRPPESGAPTDRTA